MKAKQLVQKTLKDTKLTPYMLAKKMREMGYAMPFQKLYRIKDKKHAHIDSAIELLQACRKCLGMSWAEFGKLIDN